MVSAEFARGRLLSLCLLVVPALGDPTVTPPGGYSDPAAKSLAQAATLCGPEWVATFAGATAVDGPVHALAVFDDGSGPALYAGGTFPAAGAAGPNLARWDGAGWSGLGTGANGSVYALAVFDDGGGPALYAAGDFTMVDGVAANRIARWDGVGWSPLGAGVDDWIRTLQVYDDGSGPALYAGGGFLHAGGAAAGHIARWDGGAWSALGGGANGLVLALTVFDDGQGGGSMLYAGGSFLAVDGFSSERLARWDGSAWSSIGAVGGTVRALQVFDDGSGPGLYAAGQISSAGGVAVAGLARWDGLGWSGLGAGVDGHLFHQVGALAVHDDGSGPALYAGGSFTEAGGSSANRMARWDGAAWAALGSGIGATDWWEGVDALAVFDDGSGPALYIGGDFVDTPAGDAYLARWGGCEAFPGDVDGDGDVDLSDLAEMLIDFGCQSPPAAVCVGDADGDGDTDIADLAVLLANFGE